MAVDGGGGGAGVGDLEGEGARWRRVRTVPKSRAMGESVMGGWGGGAEEADEVERGAGVGGDFERADAGGGGRESCGVKVTVRVQLAEGRIVVQLCWRR